MIDAFTLSFWLTLGFGSAALLLVVLFILVLLVTDGFK